jgi:hypothetical protein
VGTDDGREGEAAEKGCVRRVEQARMGGGKRAARAEGGLVEVTA